MSEASDASYGKYYVYVLLSLEDGGWYIGFTTNLRERLVQHAKGASLATRFRRPFKLIFYEYFIDKADAKNREKYLKSGFGRKQLKEALKTTMLGIGD